MILVRSDASGQVFLVREEEEEAALESLRRSYQARPIEILQRSEGLLLVRVLGEGGGDPPSDLAIERADYPVRKK